MASTADPTALLQELAERASVIMTTTGAGVHLLEGGRLVSAGTSRPVLAVLGAIQQQHQEGPGLESATTGRTVAVTDLDGHSAQWPAFSSSAGAVGIRSVVAIPLRSGDSVLGAMSLYHSQPREWGVQEIRPARLLADLAAGFLDMSRRLDEQRRLTDQLQRALDSRIIIEQAKGIVAVHRNVGMEEAFELLRRHANAHGATLEATVDAVVRLGLRP